MASLHLPVVVSLNEYHISCELRIELYLVLYGWFSQIKNKMLPSAEIVGLSSASSELMLTPRFSILRMVSGRMILSFCSLSTTVVSMLVWAVTYCRLAAIHKRSRILFMG